MWNSLANPPPLDGGTGGGISAVWPIPNYQTTFGATKGNGGSGTMRNVPDVAAVADPVTGVAVYSALNGGWVQVGGTSVGAPLWAGVFSLVDAASEGLGFGPAGYANPELANLGIFEGPIGAGFNYVQVGNNGDPTYSTAMHKASTLDLAMTTARAGVRSMVRTLSSIIYWDLRSTALRRHHRQMV